MEPISETMQTHTVREELLQLLPEKAVFWPDRNLLIIADVHLGKAAHFRKAGIPIPAGVHRRDFSVMHQLLQTYQPQQVIFLGDLFHSDLNNEWWDFEEFIQYYSSVHFILIKGNHDVLPPVVFQLKNFLLLPEFMEIGPFVLSHIPIVTEKAGMAVKYNIAGHIHPGICLPAGAGKQIKLPCYYFGETGAVLPAFGQFTGYISVKRKKGDQIFVIIPSNQNDAKVIHWL